MSKKKKLSGADKVLLIIGIIDMLLHLIDTLYEILGK